MVHCHGKYQDVPINQQQDVRQFDFRKKHTPHHPNALRKYHKRNKNKAQKSYSVANVFSTATKPMRRQRKRGHERDNCDTTIINVLNDHMGEVGSKIAKDAVDTFDEVLESHLENIMSIKEKDGRFKQMISEAISKLIAPLISRNGDLKSLSYPSNSRTLGDANATITANSNIDADCNIKKYKQIIDMEQKNLRDYWKQWEDIHDEYLALGTEVFGSECFEETTVCQRNGFKCDMELLDLQHKTKIIELEDEIEKLSSHIVQQMKKSEKDLDLIMKREKNRVLASLVNSL